MTRSSRPSVRPLCGTCSSFCWQCISSGAQAAKLQRARADFGLAFPFNPKLLPVKGLKLEGTPWCAHICVGSLPQPEQISQVCS